MSAARMYCLYVCATKGTIGQLSWRSETLIFCTQSGIKAGSYNKGGAMSVARIYCMCATHQTRNDQVQETTKYVDGDFPHALYLYLCKHSDWWNETGSIHRKRHDWPTVFAKREINILYTIWGQSMTQHGSSKSSIVMQRSECD